MLTPHGLDPGYAAFPHGLDPADLFVLRGPAALVASLVIGRKLGGHLLSERLDNLASDEAQQAALRVLAACPSQAWCPGADHVSARLQLSTHQVRKDLRDAVKAWDTGPQDVAHTELHQSSDVRSRLKHAHAKSPTLRWTPLAAELDARLLEQADWPATAALMQQAHAQGHDVGALTRSLVTEAPLGESPASELRFRLVACVNLEHAWQFPTEPPEPADAPRRVQDLDSPSNSPPGHYR